MSSAFTSLPGKKSWPPGKIQLLARTLKAIAHPVRLSVIEMLRDGSKRSVTEIYTRLNADQSAVSHHLILLKDRGILDSDRDGKYIHYFLKRTEILELIDCLSVAMD
ncbi:MAG: metalloregulator ArsR/SmtB family transcription factor [Bacteroidia bacterium]